MPSQDKENNKEDTKQKHAQSTPMNECRFPLSKSPETGVSETQGKQVISIYFVHIWERRKK